MSNQDSNRRNFLKMLGLSAGAVIASTGAVAKIIEQEEIHRLNPEQQKFMLQYGQWMDEFVEVIRIQKSEPANMDNHRKMMQLTETAETWQPELTEMMKDRTFALIYHASIDKMKNEI